MKAKVLVVNAEIYKNGDFSDRKVKYSAFVFRKEMHKEFWIFSRVSVEYAEHKYSV